MRNAIQLGPNYDELPIGRYSDAGQVGIFRFWYGEGVRAASMLANRGCRARCSFCTVRHFNGPHVRELSVNAIVDDIERHRDVYGIAHVTWLDDDLLFNVGKCVALFDEIVRRNLGITWDGSNGVIASAVVVHPEIIDAAARSGCIGLAFGIESGSPRILKEIHKPSGIKHFLELGQIMRRYPGIFTKGFLIIGFPNETIAEIRNTIALAHEMDLDWYSIQILTPFRQTEITRQFEDGNILDYGTLNAGVREGERQRRVERGEATTYFSMADVEDSSVPVHDELEQIWFDVDFLINYPRQFDQHDRIRLDKIRRFLTDVCDRRVGDNPIPNLFLALAERRLGDKDSAHERIEAARTYFAGNPYWTRRLERIGIAPESLIARCLQDHCRRQGS